MPWYFFNVHDGHDFPEHEGIELADLVAVRTEAMRYAGEMLQDGTTNIWTDHEWELVVGDATGACVLTLTIQAEDHSLVD